MSARKFDRMSPFAARRRRLAQLLFVAATISFLALVVLMATLPDAFARPLGDGPVTLAMLAAALEILLIVVATGAFAHAANVLQDREEAARRAREETR